MAEVTIVVEEPISEQSIQQIEQLLYEIDGIDRALFDTADGEVKVEFDEKTISSEHIVDKMKRHGFNMRQ